MEVGFVAWAEVVPGPVRWFWKALSVGEVPWCYEGGQGTFEAAPEDTPFILCPDDETRMAFAVELLREARKS